MWTNTEQTKLKELIREMFPFSVFDNLETDLLAEYRLSNDILIKVSFDNDNLTMRYKDEPAIVKTYAEHNVRKVIDDIVSFAIEHNIKYMFYS